MIESIIEPTVQWAATNGPPNAVFVVALLTKPASWSKRAVGAANKYLPGGSADESSSSDSKPGQR